jgi:hypothetical protein
VDDDLGHGTCLSGRVFPVDCQVGRHGAIGCACYVPSVQLADWEALRLIHRWRVMREHYIARRAEFDRHE